MEHECKEILESIGIKTTGSHVAVTVDDAVEMSRTIGYPVVLKIVSPDVIHKTDAGGVKLNVRNEEGVRKAFQEIMDAFKNCTVLGVSVQKMADPGIEAIIGVTRDPSFGPVLMFGLGGVFVEVLKDVTFRILPINEDDASEMIEEIKGVSLLKGYRGQAADIDALRGLLLKVSDLVTEHPEIREMDLNPVFLYPSGCLAVDARIYVDDSSGAAARSFPDNRSLYDFFYPRSIAVLGATDSVGKLGYNVFRNLLHHGFHGKLYPINPKKETVLGVKAYKSVLDVEDPIDTAIVIVPAETVPQAIEDCCAKGSDMWSSKQPVLPSSEMKGNGCRPTSRKSSEKRDAVCLGRTARASSIPITTWSNPSGSSRSLKGKHWAHRPGRRIRSGHPCGLA